jgi:hypothetical protein
VTRSETQRYPQQHDRSFVVVLSAAYPAACSRVTRSFLATRSSCVTATIPSRRRTSTRVTPAIASTSRTCATHDPHDMPATFNVVSLACLDACATRVGNRRFCAIRSATAALSVDGLARCVVGRLFVSGIRSACANRNQTHHHSSYRRSHRVPPSSGRDRAL